MARHKELYKGRRRLHGEGTGRFCTVNLREEIANEFKLVVKAYSEVYGERVTPTQVIKRLMDAGLKRCDPEVFDALIRLTEGGMPEPVLEIVHQVDPTEGEVWNMKYYFEKDGEQIAAEWAKSDKASFSVKINNRSCGVREMLKNGWILMNDAGIEINEEQAMIIAQKRKKHLEDVEFQAFYAYTEEENFLDEYQQDYKFKLEKDGEVKEVSHYELQGHLEDGWKLSAIPHTEISMRDFED